MNKKIIIPLLMAGIGIYLITTKNTNKAVNIKPKDTQQFGSYDQDGNWIPQKITVIR